MICDRVVRLTLLHQVADSKRARLAFHSVGRKWRAVKVTTAGNRMIGLVWVESLEFFGRESQLEPIDGNEPFLTCMRLNSFLQSLKVEERNGKGGRERRFLLDDIW